ncbi:MAG: penicillin-binding protein 2 [Actinomycetota bacterium]
MSKRPKKIGTRPVTGRRKARSSAPSSATAASSKSFGLDRIRLRLLVFGVMLIAIFVALFTRLWFLQVLAGDEYQALARENRVRRVDSEPPRGRIFDRNGVLLVDNRPTSSITIDRQLVDEEDIPRVLKRLSRLLDVKVKDLEERLNDGTVSPYKPVPVANDVTEAQATKILTFKERFPGVDLEELQIRKYPQRELLAQVLGYLGEIDPEELKYDQFKKDYKAGDIIGKTGIERTYDAFLRGEPRIENVVVNADNQVVGNRVKQVEQAGNDLYLSIDIRIQELVEKALRDGIEAARGGGYAAPDGGAVIMEPGTGEVLAMASFPTFDPSILADGITQKEFDKLGANTETSQDDAMTNRPIRSIQAPGSTFKPVTAGAAMSLGVIGPYDYLSCPGAVVYPPGGGPGSQSFSNWTSADSGAVGVTKSLEISCNTFYYELGWRMESRWGRGLATGDDSERFQKYQRTAGLGDATGIDLAGESDGVVPDWAWCKEYEEFGFCSDGAGGQIWYPGYTVNMSIGQGEVKVTPLQMATTYSALLNGGTVWEPRIGYEVRKPPVQDQDELEASQSVEPDSTTEDSTFDPAVEESSDGKNAGVKTTQIDPEDSKMIKDIKAKRASKLPLDETQLSVIREGLEAVVMGTQGTAVGAFAGFPLEQFPIGGKTGTAQRGETGENDSWFLSYGPTDDPGYVLAVYVEQAGHGGTTSAPIARQIWEGIARLEGVEGVDTSTDVSLASDGSG